MIACFHLHCPRFVKLSGPGEKFVQIPDMIIND